jgi:hypothetical protein
MRPIGNIAGYRRGAPGAFFIEIGFEIGTTFLTGAGRGRGAEGGAALGGRRRPVRALFMCVCWFVRRLRSVHVLAWMPILSTSTRFPLLQATQKFKVLIEN